MESFLSELASMVYSRMQQFWKLDRWVRITDIEGNPSFVSIGQEILSNNFDLKVQAGSTMPVNRNAMLDLMIRLAQTNGEDGLPLVDRKAVLEFLPTGDKKAITDRFAELQARQQQAQQEQLAQEQAMAQQQQGELNMSTTQQVMQMIEQLIQASDMTAKQVDELIMDKENREKKEYESKIEEKGYKKGLKEGQSMVQTEEEQVEENPEKEAMVKQLLADNKQMETALNSQSIPNEVLEELLAIAKEDPQTLIEIMQQYPQLAEMLKQDIDIMNGGQING